MFTDKSMDADGPVVFEGVFHVGHPEQEPEERMPSRDGGQSRGVRLVRAG